jgi:hypothetical protein
MAAIAEQNSQGGNSVCYIAGVINGADRCCQLLRFRPLNAQSVVSIPSGCSPALKTKLRQVGTRRSFDCSVEIWKISGEIPQLPTR